MKKKQEINKSTKKKNSIGQIIAMLLVIAVLTCILFHSIFSIINKNENTYIVRYGNISKEEALSGLFIKQISIKESLI